MIYPSWVQVKAADRECSRLRTERFLNSLIARTKRGGFDVEVAAEEFRTWRQKMSRSRW
jgi:hypothetical protein